MQVIAGATFAEEGAMARLEGNASVGGVIRLILLATLLFIFLPLSSAQQLDRVKVAEGEYRVTEDGDMGVGPVETEVFHFRESWTLWRLPSGEYELEGDRAFESPRDHIRDNPFIARLAADLQVLEVKEFTHLRFRPDSGPLTCQLLPQELRCESGARDSAHVVDARCAMDRPYGLLWPLSAFSLASLTRAAPKGIGQKAVVQVVQLEEISDVLPVLTIRSDGLIRSLGPSERAFEILGKQHRANMYELTAGPIRKMTIWTSVEGLLLAAERPGAIKERMELVRFTKFADF
jgi:hypothetical protein